jgi:Domain of unknown function (DUF4440)
VERTSDAGDVSDAREQRQSLMLDYEQTLETYRQFTDIRFRLLAFVPTLSGVAVALLTNAALHGSEKVALAGLGFFVTLGIVLYDLRNTQFYNGTISRAQHLEDDLHLERFETDERRGLFGSRDEHQRKRFFGLPIGHDLGLAFIYSAVLGAWVFGAVLGGTDSTGTAVAAGGGLAALAFLQFEWLDGQPKKLRKRVRKWRRTMNERKLIQLNMEFADREKQRDKRFFERILANGMTFRRADGSRVEKDAYLDALEDPANTYDMLESDDIEAIVFDSRTALVSLRVDARGKRNDKPFEGGFRNTRLFVKQRGHWKCAVWFNSREDA